MHVDPSSREQAIKAIQANQSPRFQRLDLLDRYVETTQYEGKASYWDDSKPLFDRAPATVYPIVDTAIRSHVSMVLGEGRFPEITSGTDEDDRKFDDAFGLSEDESSTLDKFLTIVGRHTRWQTVYRQMLFAAMSSKTACLVVGVLNGRLKLDVVPAKWCTPTFQNDSPDAPVTKLEIRYGYTKEERNEATNTVEVKAYLFRRVIDESSDTTYLPVEASADGTEPREWKADPKQTVPHGLGFCPVHWYRHMRGTSVAGDIDGHAIHEKLTDEITALDYCESQVVRAVLYTTDPILLEIGVDQGFNPTGDGERRSIMLPGDPESMAQWQRPPTSAADARKGRKRGPGLAYQYPNAQSKVQFLTLPEGAMAAAEKNALRLFAKIAEAMHWLPIDPKDMMSGAQLSGRSLEWLHKRQVDYDVEIRTDFGDNAMLPAVDLVLRVVHKLGPTGGLYLPGLAKVLPILTKFMRSRRKAADSQETEDVWMPPDFRLKWPAFFPDTAADAKADGENARADMQSGIINRKTAVARVAKHYGIQDPGKYHDDMEAEEQKRKAEEEAKAHDASLQLQQAASLRRGGAQPGQPPPRGATAPAQPQRQAPARQQVKPPTSRLGAGRLTARRNAQKAAA
jgi:hypothetical protein